MYDFRKTEGVLVRQDKVLRNRSHSLTLKVSAVPSGQIIYSIKEHLTKLHIQLYITSHLAPIFFISKLLFLFSPNTSATTSYLTRRPNVSKLITYV